MKIALIGGSGFVGTRLVSRLENKENLRIYDKQVSEIFPHLHTFCDVTDYDSLSSSIKTAEVIINLAAEHRDDVTPLSLYQEVNVEGAKNVCKLADSLGIKRIIFTSSVSVYGNVDKETSENGELNYFNEYGRTKKEAEDVYKEWFNADPINRCLIIIRPTVIFGENNRGNVYNLLKQIASGKFLMVGKGNNIKSMAYVENVAAFIIFCTNNIQSGFNLFNYVDKPDFDMNHLISKINLCLGRLSKNNIHWPLSLALTGGLLFDFVARIANKKLSISSIRIKKFCMNTHFSSSNIKKTTFIPPVKIEEGLKRTIEHEFIKQ